MYREYDQAGLDAQYNLRARVPNFQDHFDHYDRESGRVRASLPCRLDVAYGESPGERVDLFPARAPGGPVQIFIHGGYWQLLDKANFSFVAEPFVQAGCAVAVINYDLAPNVTMDEIVRQARNAVVWSYRNAATFGGDPQRIYVSGHSAGGHLTAMVMSADWSAHGDLPADLVKGGCAISGLFELEPVRRTYLNEGLRLDEAMAHRNSPLNLLPSKGAPLIVAVGSEETEEFLRHSREYAAAWEEKGHPCRHLVLEGHDHFTIVEELGRAESPLTRAVLEQMGLPAPG